MYNAEPSKKLFSVLKEYLKDNSQYSPIVQTTAEGSTYPKIVVEEIENMELINTFTMHETTSLIGVGIEISANPITKGTKKIASRTIANELLQLCAEVCEAFGMKRVNVKKFPNSDGGNMFRIVVQYNVLQSDQRGRFY